MDPQLFQIIVALVVGLLTIIGAGIAWWVNGIQETLRGQQKQMVELMTQISTLNIELAKNYAPRQELQQTFDRIFALLQEIQREVRHA
jgi:uncharacterized membrane-anchored protein YhcB (DUF1043 family)